MNAAEQAGILDYTDYKVIVGFVATTIVAFLVGRFTERRSVIAAKTYALREQIYSIRHDISRADYPCLDASDSCLKIKGALMAFASVTRKSKAKKALKCYEDFERFDEHKFRSFDVITFDRIRDPQKKAECLREIDRLTENILNAL